MTARRAPRAGRHVALQHGPPLLVLVLLVTLVAGPVRAQEEPAGQAEPTLATGPRLRTLVPAEVPEGTVFPAPEVAVVLTIDVDEGGRVTNVVVAEGVGEPFDSAALAAARRFEFDPGLLTTGEAVPVTVTFRMRIEAPPPPPVTLTGRLVERGTRKPISAVPVAVKAPGEGGEILARAETDAEGRFEVQVPVARFVLVAVPAGHERLEAEVEAEPGESREETYFLETTSSGFETIVKGSRPRREVTKRVIPKAVVQRVAGTSGDTLKVVQSLPGVARASFGGGDLVLRGANPQDSRIFLEGQEIPLIYHFGGLRSTFNNYFLEEVEFIPGNFGPEYGRATGGVIDVRVREPSSDLFRGEVDVNLYDAGFALEGPVTDGLAMGGAFHRSYIDTLLPLFIPDDSPVSFDTAPRYYDYQFLTSWKPAKGHRLRFFWYGSMDKLELVLADPGRDPKIRGTVSGRLLFHNVQLAYDARLLPWLQQESSIVFGWQQFRTVFGPDFFFDLDNYRFGLRSTWTADATSWLRVRAGLDMQLADVHISLSAPQPPKEGEPGVPISTQETLGVSKSTVIVEPGAFLELEFRPLPNLVLLPSVRLDALDVTGEVVVDPRFTVRYEPIAGTLLKAGVGLYQKPPQPNEADPTTGSDELLYERSLQASLGVEQRIIEGLDVELTGFYKDLDNIVVRNSEMASDPTAPPYVNDGTGRIYGLEFLFRARIGEDFFGWIAYTFQRSLRTDRPGAEERPFDFDQPHMLTVLGSYHIGWGWYAGLRFRLVSGNPETPVVDSVYDASSDTYVPIYGTVNSERLALFHQLDLRIDKIFTFEKWKLDVYLDVQNVYNQGNQEGWRQSYDYRQRSKLTGLPILPIFGVKGEW